MPTSALCRRRVRPADRCRRGCSREHGDVVQIQSGDRRCFVIDRQC